MDKFEQIFRKNHVDLRTAAKKSSNWFNQQAYNLSRQNIRPERLIRDSAEKNVNFNNQITPGELYLFNYDAKHKDTLPYWDTFPLVFPFKKLPGGFIGLNMHYLPYQLRIMLLTKLMQFKTGTNEMTRLKLSWQLLQGLSTNLYVQPCVHRYLITHVKSPLKRIDSEDWATAMLLPVERFQGASKQKVWAESRR